MMLKVRLGVYSMKAVNLVGRALRCFSGPIIIWYEMYIDDDNEVCVLVSGADGHSEQECKDEIVHHLRSYSSRANYLCTSQEEKRDAEKLADIIAGKPTADSEAIRGRRLNQIEVFSVQVLLDELKKLSRAAYRYARMGLSALSTAEKDDHVVSVWEMIDSIRYGRR